MISPKTNRATKNSFFSKIESDTSLARTSTLAGDSEAEMARPMFRANRLESTDSILQPSNMSIRSGTDNGIGASTSGGE